MPAGSNKTPKRPTLTRSELIARITADQRQLPEIDVELAVNSILKRMTSALSSGERIEIRGFGSLTLHHRRSRMARNPKTGEKVYVPEKRMPHFKPGLHLRKKVNRGNTDN